MKSKSIWKTKGFKSWFFTTLPLTALILTAGSVLTANEFLHETMNAVFGGERRVAKSGNPDDYQYYVGEYDNKKDSLAAGNKLNERIVSEGITLLKNETLDGTKKSLPLANKAKVSVFGKNSANLVYGGSGSNSNGFSGANKTIHDSLAATGFVINPKLEEFYQNNKASGSGRPASPSMNSTITGLTGFPTGETPVSSYTSDVKASFAEYNDAALVVISRIGGEGFDLPRTMFWDGKDYQNWNGDQLIPGARSKDDHYLQLDQNETDMIKMACENFENVVILLNTPSTFEAGFLDDATHYGYQENIKGCLWIGGPGKTGFMALGKVLNGEIAPSGRTPDTYVRNFKNDPTWANFSNNLKAGGNQYMDEGGTKRSAYSVHYEEGIYTGYRYYETRGAMEDETWYKNNVVFPFGYGLSYSKFDWDIVNSTPVNHGELNADDEINITVKVTNSGEVASKEVVELYCSAPYTPGGIEKSAVNLGDFAKTKVLEPGESEDVTLTIRARDMASYDYNDANNNGFKGYELEKGEYNLYVARNAHDRALNIKLNVADDITYQNDDATNTVVTNLFDDTSYRIEKYLSRNDWNATWPNGPTSEILTLNKQELKKMGNYKINDKDSDPWYNPVMPHQEEAELTYEQAKTKLWHLIGKDYDDPLWDTLLDELTVAQMSKLIQTGVYHTGPIANIDKPKTTDADGPMGFALFMGDNAVYETVYYASETVVAATYNKELAKEFGDMIGNESLVGNVKGDGATYPGWYAPAVNTHRSQFAGRNFEYYSEDPILASKMAVETIKAAKEKGVYTYIKHFALNEQETNRDTNGIATWANEQCLREIYFKPFEAAVKQAHTTAMMSSFNRIGFTWAGGSYPLLTKLLRDEWGFKGMVITDFNLTPYMNVDQMIRAGGDLNLSQSKAFENSTTATSVNCIRNATKNILYTIGNSNAMNGFGEGVRYAYAAPIWFIILWSCCGGLLAGLLIWGGFILAKIIKTDKKAKEKGEFEDGKPYNVEKRVKVKDYKLSKASIIYASITGVVLTSSIAASIALLAVPDKKQEVIENPNSFVSSARLQINHKDVENNALEIILNTTETYVVSAVIDSYNVSNDNYVISSSNESVLTIEEGTNKILPHAVGEVTINLTLPNYPDITSNIFVSIIDPSIITDNNIYTISTYGCLADKVEGKVGDVITLKPSDFTYPIESYVIKAANEEITDIWQNGNTFKMPASNVTVTADYYLEHNAITLENMTFEDGSNYKVFEKGDVIDLSTFKVLKDGEEFSEPTSFKDETGILYRGKFTMPDHAIKLAPTYVWEGTDVYHSAETRGYPSAVKAVKSIFNGYKTTTYTLQKASAGSALTVCNRKDPDGVFVANGTNATATLLIMNHSNIDLDMNVNLEIGQADVLVPAHSFKIVEIELTGNKYGRNFYKYTFKNEVTEQISIQLAEFIK